MDVKRMMLEEFDLEMAATRRFLERVPMERAEFAPHARSTKLGPLASHVARLPQFTRMMLRTQEFDFAQSDPSAWENASTGEELLALFDRSTAEARAALADAPEAALAQEWTLRAGEEVFFQAPRWLAHRRLAMNHLVHHRGQLGVYLRLLDIPVPSAYGPTADES